MRGFHGQHFFLHSGYPALVEWNGVFYKTVEHAFSVSRTNDDDAIARIRAASTHQEAAILGRMFQARSPAEMEHVWQRLTRQKFTLHEDLGVRLANTGRQLLVHEDPHDLFFGTWNGVGHNRAGKFLMELRTEIRNSL